MGWRESRVWWLFVCFRSVSLQREMEQMRDQHEDSMQKLKARHNADMSHFQQEHSLSAAKASSLTSDIYTCFTHCSSWQLNFYWTQNILSSVLTFWFTSIGKIPDILALFQTGLLHLLLQHPNPIGVTELKRNYRSVIPTQILLLTWRE